MRLVTTEPRRQPFELLCEDQVGTYVIPFCRCRNGAWRSLDTDKCIKATVVGWQVPSQKSALNLEVFC